MKLARIRIEQFKQFRKPIEIGGLEDKINLFAGPNEAGKSTVVAAIRAAFFERHRSSSVDDLCPWEDSSASPTVEIEFVIDNKTCRLTKSFLSKKRCQLQVGTQRFDGASAEEYLSGLLGFKYATKGASSPQHWGIPGLLWIQQGSAQDINNSVTHAADRLQTALNQSLGEVASSSGDEVLAIVEVQRNQLLSTSKGLPRDVYADALKRQSEFEGKLKDIDSDIETYRQKVDTLTSLQREHTADQIEKSWEIFRAKEQEARGKLLTVERLQESLVNDESRLGELDTQIQILRTQAEAFSQQEQVVKIREEAVEQAAPALSVATSLVEQWSTKLATASGDHESARETLRLARQEETRAELRGQLEELKQKADEVKTRLGKAEEKEAALRDLQRQVIASEIDIADLNLLRYQHSQLTELRIRRTASATRLRFNLTEGHSIQIDEELKSCTGEVLLLEPTIVHLAELGQLEILPGGDDLADLGRQEKATNIDHMALLQRLGLASLEAAETRYQIYIQLVAEVKAVSEMVKTFAPKGLEALRADTALQMKKAKETELSLKQLPAAPDNIDKLLSVSQATAIEETTQRALNEIRANLNRAEIATGKFQAELSGAKRELVSAQAVLDTPDRATKMAKVNEELIDARATRTVLVANMETRKSQVAQAHPALKQDVERYRASADQHERRFRDREKILWQYEGDLKAAGAQGLEERRAELAGALMQAQRQVDELRTRSTALDFLLRLLREKRVALTRRLQTPLQKHLNRYLQLLFPGAQLEIDENLIPGPLTRTRGSSSESADFEALSFGSREQMGIISRLAYADLLKEAGWPTLIILDDALVHSDEERLNQMKRVLFDAATRHQILLFTCHPEDWRDIGVTPRSLESVR